MGGTINVYSFYSDFKTKKQTIKLDHNRSHDLNNAFGGSD